MKRGALLTAIYAAVATFTFLYVYPVAPEKPINLVVAAALALTAGYTAYALPFFSSLTMFFAEVLAALNILAASEAGKEGLYALLLSSMPILGYEVLLTLLYVAGALSVRRRRGVAAIATGMLAGVALTKPYGHLVALSLLAIYAVVSASPSRTIISVTSFEYIRAPVFLALATRGLRACFTWAQGAAMLRPVRPLVDALLAPTGRPSPTIVQASYPTLLYLASTFAAYLAVFAITSWISARVSARIARFSVEGGAITKQTVIFAALAAPLAFMLSVIASMSSSLFLLHCNPSAPRLATLTLAAATGVIAALTQLLTIVSRLRSLTEEKRSLLESIDALINEVARIVEEARSAGIETRGVALLEEHARRLRELREKAEKAGLLDLPGVERLLAEEERRVHEAIGAFRAELREIMKSLRSSCVMLSEWAAEHDLVTDCVEEVVRLEPQLAADIHVALAAVAKALAALRSYIEELIDDAEDAAEAHGVDYRSLEALRAKLAELRVTDPGDIGALAEVVVSELGKVLGAIRARGE